MLIVVNEETMRIRPETVKNVTVCARKAILKKPFVEVFELENGNNIVFPMDDAITYQSYGRLYVETGGVNVQTENISKDQINFIVVGSNVISKKAEIEVIECKDGTVIVNPLTKGIIMEKVDSDYIMTEIN